MNVKQADKLQRVDLKLDSINNLRWNIKKSFERLVCPKCNNKTFEVLYTDDYETSVRCCGRYYIIHDG